MPPVFESRIPPALGGGGGRGGGEANTPWPVLAGFCLAAGLKLPIETAFRAPPGCTRLGERGSRFPGCAGAGWDVPGGHAGTPLLPLGFQLWPGK